MNKQPAKPRRGILAEAFQPFFVLITIVMVLAGLYLALPILLHLRELAHAIAEETSIPPLYVKAGMAVLGLGAAVWFMRAFVAPVFRHPCYAYSGPQLLEESRQLKIKGENLQSRRKLYRFRAITRKLGNAPEPENMDAAYRSRYETCVAKLQSAESDEGKCEALRELGRVREEHMKSIVFNHVFFVSLSTAVSRRSWMDAYLVLVSNFRMIRELIIASGHRPSYKDCLMLYGRSIGYALTSITAEELTTYLSTVQAIKTGSQMVRGVASSAAGIIAKCIAFCVNPAAGVSAGVTLNRIFDNVGKTAVDCSPAMMDGFYNGWRTMRLGYHLSTLLTQVYHRHTQDGASMWQVARDLPEVVRAMMANIFFAIGKNFNTGEQEIKKAHELESETEEATQEPAPPSAPVQQYPTFPDEEATEEPRRP